MISRITAGAVAYEQCLNPPPILNEPSAPCKEGGSVYTYVESKEFLSRRRKKVMIFYTPHSLWGPALHLNTGNEMSEDAGTSYKNARVRCQPDLMRKPINLDKYLRCIKKQIRSAETHLLTPFRGFAALIEVPPGAVPVPPAPEAFSNPGYTSSNGHLFLVSIELREVLPLDTELHGGRIWLLANAPVVP